MIYELFIEYSTDLYRIYKTGKTVDNSVDGVEMYAIMHPLKRE